MNLAIPNLLVTHPNSDFIFVAYAWAIVISFFIASFLVEIIRKKFLNDLMLKKALRRAGFWFRTLSIVALVMTWSRLEGVPYLSMRIHWIILLLVCFYITTRIVMKYRKLTKRHKKYHAKVEDEKDRLKYLPRKKK